MLISRLHQFFTKPNQRQEKYLVFFWLTFSIIFATFYSFLALQKAFASEYVAQDDARQFVFWMQRFIEPGLLPNDLIAEYYQSITPPGFATLYWGMAKIGIAPLILSKILPMILGIITTVYVFGVTMQIFPIPAAGFIATLLLNQSIWLRNDLSSATPKAFVYPLFAAFLYYLLRGSLISSLVAIALQSLFFPPVAMISAFVLLLRLVNWEGGLLQLSRQRKDYLFSISGLVISGLCMLPYAISSGKFGPLFTIDQAKSMPEFMAGARVSFFYKNNPLQFWLIGPETGIFPYVGPVQIFLGMFLPILLRYSKYFPLSSAVKSNLKILNQVTLGSFIMFFLAHLLMFKLYGPSRYTQHTLRIVLAIASAIFLILLLDAMFHWIKDKVNTQKIYLLPLGFSLLIFLGLVFYPSFLKKFPRPSYIVGAAPSLYQFLQQQPKDSLTASLSLEANNLPTFAKRPILIAREYALPFHTKYYHQIRQRTSDLIIAQYSPDINQLQQFIQKYGVDFWLLDQKAFDPTYFQQMEAGNRRWINLFQPAAKIAMTNLEQGNTPALAKLVNSCAVVQMNDWTLLQANCILHTSRIKNY